MIEICGGSCANCICQKMTEKENELFEHFQLQALDRIFAIKLKEGRVRNEKTRSWGWTSVFFGTTYDLSGPVSEALKEYFDEYYKIVQVVPNRVGYHQVRTGWILRLHGPIF